MNVSVGDMCAPLKHAEVAVVHAQALLGHMQVAPWVGLDSVRNTNVSLGHMRVSLLVKRHLSAQNATLVEQAFSMRPERDHRRRPRVYSTRDAQPNSARRAVAQAWRRNRYDHGHLYR